MKGRRGKKQKRGKIGKPWTTKWPGGFENGNTVLFEGKLYKVVDVPPSTVPKGHVPIQLSDETTVNPVYNKPYKDLRLAN